MITVHKADLIFKQKLPSFGTEYIPFGDSVGRVIAENIKCDRDLPPFDRVAMDGIAINFSAYQNGIKSFKIEDIQKAGDPCKKLNDNQFCLEVMTGAVLPQSTDAVIRFEDLTVKDNIATINDRVEIKKKQNIHFKGSDKLKDDLIIPVGHKISIPDIGILASVGKAQIKVQKTPSIAIVSTGNELVEVIDAVLPHQIRRSNIFAIEACLKSFGFNQATLHHLTDDEENIKKNLPSILENHDVIILSGGVSMGKFDLIPSSLLACGIEEKFHKIKQKPGKPFWYGTNDKKFIYALPGNPVSTLLCLLRYVIPHLRTGAGMTTIQKYAVLEKEMSFKKPITFFQPGFIGQNKSAQLTAMPVESNGSGDYASLQGTDGFLEFNEYQSLYPIGSIVPFYSWK
jgi:molybdopterin molybdotransferase